MVLKLKTRARERSSNTVLPLHTWLATNAALSRCACKIPSFRSYRSCVTQPKPDQLIVVPKSNQTATVSHEPFVRKVSLIPTLKGTDIAGLENLRQLLWFWAFLWRVNVLHFQACIVYSRLGGVRVNDIDQVKTQHPWFEFSLGYLLHFFPIVSLPLFPVSPLLHPIQQRLQCCPKSITLTLQYVWIVSLDIPDQTDNVPGELRGCRAFE